MNPSTLTVPLLAATFLGLTACSTDTPGPARLGRAVEPLVAEGQVCLGVQRGTSGQVADAIVWQNAPRWSDGAGARLSTGTSLQGGRRRLASIVQDACSDDWIDRFSPMARHSTGRSVC
jgi:hypothetical protein